MAHNGDQTKSSKATGHRGAGAADILRRRYVGDDAGRGASVQEERVNAQVAQMIYDQRTAAGLSQQQLADLIDTTQSVISRLERADYEGHSLTMLDRIARAINKRLRVEMKSAEERTLEEEPTDQSGAEAGSVEPEDNTIHFVFRELVRSLRRKRGLTVEQLAQKLGVEHDEVLAMERNPGYRPKPLLLYKVSQFYDIPQRRLAVLAGAVAHVPADVREQASRFAAKSESFSKLTRDEQRTLDEFVSFLKSDA